MSTSISIRDLYIPVQPTVKPTAADVNYYEFLPHQHLQNFIYCYWQLKTTVTLTEEFNYKVVADGCIDIFFELNDTRENFVMGFCKRYTEFSLGNDFNYVGVRFLPTMFPTLFGINASELSNRVEYLSTVVPQVADFITDNFCSGQRPEHLKQLFDTYFLQLVADTDPSADTRLYKAVTLIMKNQGVLDIERDLDTGIGPRQLRRLFEFYIGDTAKTFSKVVRFQNILRAKPSTQSLKQNKLFFDAGYYDQAHFIKEFKNFYGVTPGKVFGR